MRTIGDDRLVRIKSGELASLASTLCHKKQLAPRYQQGLRAGETAKCDVFRSHFVKLRIVARRGTRPSERVDRRHTKPRPDESQGLDERRFGFGGRLRRTK